MVINKFVFLLIFLLWKFSGAVVLERNFQTGMSVNPGDTIKITTTIRNNDIDTLIGLVYSEQVPFEVEVIYFSVSINNSVYNGITFERGKSADIGENEIPYRWIFQLPPGFNENGYLAPGDSAVIKYGLTRRVDTVFYFNQDAWYSGLISAGELYPIFGYDTLLNVQLTFTPSSALRNKSTLLSEWINISDNYPNPFNPTTSFRVNIKEPVIIYLNVFDINGKRVDRVERQCPSAGVYVLNWEETDLASGVYFYTIQAFHQKNKYHELFTIKRGKLVLIK